MRWSNVVPKVRDFQMFQVILGQISIVMQPVTAVMSVAILAHLWRYNDEDNDMNMKTVFRTVYNVDNDARLRFHDFVHSWLHFLYITWHVTCYTAR